MNLRQKIKTIFSDLLLPLLVLVSVSLFFRFTGWDIYLVNFFFSPDTGWIYKDNSLVMLLYRCGTLPALILSFTALILLLGSFIFTLLQPCRKAALFFVLLMCIGPGITVNAVFKNHWGRPRPRESIVFSGEKEFLPVWKKGAAGNGKSFPSGHASMGFFLFSPFFLLRRKFPGWAVAFLLTGIGAGTLMGLARMAQGAHFPSDVVWSAGFTYLLGIMLYHFLDVAGDRLPRPS